MFGKIIGGILGNEDAKRVDIEGAKFQPYTVTSGVGSADTTFDDDGNMLLNASLNQPVRQAQEQALAGYGQFGDTLSDLASVNAGQFSPQGFNSANQGMTGGMMGTNFSGQPFDVGQATDDYFQQGLGVLNPQFAQQNANLAQSLQGSGRGGLMLSSGAMGAGGGGMVNPDMYNTGAAQSNALANLYQQSRQSALGEQAQMYGQGLSAEQQRMLAGGQLFNQDLQTQQADLAGFNANQNQMLNYANLQNQQLQNVGMFSAMENQLMELGMTAEQARAAAAAGGSYTQPAKEGLGSQLLGAGLSAAGMAMGGPAGAVIANNLFGSSPSTTPYVETGTNPYGY